MGFVKTEEPMTVLCYLFLQAKVQLQIVAQLEQSLVRERERFHAMMAHLNKGPHSTCDENESNLCKVSSCEVNFGILCT